MEKQLITQKVTNNDNIQYKKIVPDVQLLPLAIDLTVGGYGVFSHNLEKTKQSIANQGFTVLSWCT